MKNDSQLEIHYGPPADPAAVASVEDVERVVRILETGRWLTAAEITIAMGLRPTENNKRKVRAVARAAFPGILSYVGRDGYNLLRYCTLPEAWGGVSALDNQERDVVLKKKQLLDAIHSGKVGVP